MAWRCYEGRCESDKPKLSLQPSPPRYPPLLGVFYARIMCAPAYFWLAMNQAIMHSPAHGCDHWIMLSTGIDSNGCGRFKSVLLGRVSRPIPWQGSRFGYVGIADDVELTQGSYSSLTPYEDSRGITVSQWLLWLGMWGWPADSWARQRLVLVKRMLLHTLLSRSCASGSLRL